MAREQKAEISGRRKPEPISSPEQLSDYLRVTNVGIWAMLSAIILLLAAVLIWAFVGKLETTVRAKALVTDSQARIIIADGADVLPGMTVRMGNAEFLISEVERDETGLQLAFAPVSLVNGEYGATIVVDSVAPISFLVTSK